MSHILRNQMYLHLNCKEILDSSKQMNPQDCILIFLLFISEQ